MAFEFLRYEKREHLVVLTINRPEVMNCLHLPANQELDKAFDDFSDDHDAWVAIITGAGDRAFSAGNDLKWQAQHGMDALQAGLKSLKGGFGGITRRFDCFKPIIAAVNGFALGGGFEIALSCDIIVAAEHATFGLPEPRVGLIAGAGGVHRLPRHMPYHMAMGLMLTGRQIRAQEAYQLGVVNEVVPSDGLMEAAERWAMEIMACAPLAVRACKEVSLKGMGLTLEEAVTRTYSAISGLFKSEDLVEGARAFSEKRKPQWKGR
ncbi:MAG: enoyl-CoA hydratase-related protein [Pseudomonadota bacterium]